MSIAVSHKNTDRLVYTRPWTLVCVTLLIIIQDNLN